MELRKAVRNILVLTFLVASLITCSFSTDPVDCEGQVVFNPKSFTLEQQEWIYESGDRWNVWVGYKLVTISTGERESCSISPGVIGDGFTGKCNRWNKKIVIDLKYLIELEQLDRVGFEGVIAHEIGHLLGFHHIGSVNRDALMSPVNGLDFSQLDREQCLELKICSDNTAPKQSLLLGGEE